MFRINNKIVKLLICLIRKKKRTELQLSRNGNLSQVIEKKKTEKQNLLSAINVNICKNVTKCSNLVIISFYKSLRFYQFF